MGRERFHSIEEGRLEAAKDTAEEWAKTIGMWRGFGATHLSVGTGGLGGADAQIQRLREVRDLFDPA